VPEPVRVPWIRGCRLRATGRHLLPSWYPLVTELTAETLILEESADSVAALQGSNWPGYFVKDHVKSLNPGVGSLATTPEEISRIVSRLKRYRGEVEGGVCAAVLHCSCACFLIWR